MMHLMLWMALVSGCKKNAVEDGVRPEPNRRMAVAVGPATEVDPVPEPEASGAPDLAQLQAATRVLSTRDGEPSCAEVEEVLAETDPVAAYLYIIEMVKMPPTVPMRAAGCLLAGHAEAAAPQIKRWVTEPELKGLGLLVLNRLDQLPEPLAVACVELALSGDLAEDARMAAGDSTHPGVQALITP